MKKEIEAVIFDWAGTTVDYGSFAPVQAFVEIFKAYGITPTLDEVREPMGMLKIDHIRTMLAMPRIRELWVERHGKEPEEKDVQKLFLLFEEKLMGILDQFADPKPDTLEAVKRMREMGLKIGSTTGYNDKMMSIVVPAAAAKGYQPDCWFSPDAVDQKGRPYPYMIFRNMEVLGLSDVRKIIKAGDTLSDIREGKNAGVYTVGIVVGSSEMGLTQEEFDLLPTEAQAQKCETVRQRFLDAGADAVFLTLADLAEQIAAWIGQ